MSEHTAGRVHLTDSIHNGKVYISSEGNERGSIALCQKEENARRLVACWNACEMLPTEQLEEIANDEMHGVAGLALFAKKLGADRDELIEGLNKVRWLINRAEGKCYASATDLIDALLAKHWPKAPT